MRKQLVIGASGFVGRHVTRALLAAKLEVRCSARTPSKVQDLADMGCEVVQGEFGPPLLVRVVLRLTSQSNFDCYIPAL